MWLQVDVHGCGDVCMVVGMCAWLWWTCVVEEGYVWLRGCVHGCGGHAWLQGGVWLWGSCVVVGEGVCMVAKGHAWLPDGCAWLWGACVVAGGMCGCGGHAWLLGGMVRGCEGACIGYDEIRSMSGRYASYWNAFLLSLNSLKTFRENSNDNLLGKDTK